jgi:hypothetical protein
VTESDADITVDASADLGDLQNALDSASSGDVVFIHPDATINLEFNPDSTSIAVPSGVTLASNRGEEGSPGALLTSEKKPGSEWVGSQTIGISDNVRITGLRIEGPTPDRDKNWGGSDHDYTDGIDATEASNVEIDNNKIYGWPESAMVGGDPINVHHNYIHDNDQSGLGYGVDEPMYPSTIEYNLFDTNRHAIAASGESGQGYIARYNMFEDDCVHSHHRIDMHKSRDTGLAGEKIEVHHNTVKVGSSCSGEAVDVRAEPERQSEVYNNWFQHTGYDAAFSTDDYNDYDTHGGSNEYGTTEPSSCDVGVGVRDGCSVGGEN